MIGRICILRHNYYPADVRVRREANVLLAAGFEVDVICLRLPGQPWREKINDVTVYRLPLVHRRTSRLRYAFQYAASLLLSSCAVTALHLRRRYQIVQVATMPDFLIFAALFSKLLGAKLVLDMLDPTPELYRAKYKVGKRHLLNRLIELQEGASMRCADLVITVLEEVKDLLRERHPGIDVKVVMNFPDPTVFPRRIPASTLPVPTETPLDRFVLLSHGVIVERLGFDTIIRAVARLGDSIPGLELRIVGPGQHQEELKDLAEQLGVSNRVRFFGYVPLDDVPRVIDDADVGVVANKNDGFGNLPLPTKLLEYVWMGKPTIVSRTSTIRNYFDESMVAFFEPENEKDLAQQIQELYRDPERRRALAISASRFCDQNNWSSEGERYRDLLLDLLRPGRSAGPDHRTICVPELPPQRSSTESKAASSRT